MTEINPKDYTSYVITGVDLRGKRFSRTTIYLGYAMAINLWRGSVWGIDASGRRRLLKRVTN